MPHLKLLTALAIASCLGCVDIRHEAENQFTLLANHFASNDLNGALKLLGAVDSGEFGELFATIQEEYDLSSMSGPAEVLTGVPPGPIRMLTISEIGHMPDRNGQGSYDLPKTVDGEVINHITERRFLVRKRDSGEKSLLKMTIAWGGSPLEPVLDGFGVYKATDVSFEE